MERPIGEPTAGCRGDRTAAADGSRESVASGGAGKAALARERPASARALDRVRSRDAILSLSLSLRETESRGERRGKVLPEERSTRKHRWPGPVNPARAVQGRVLSPAPFMAHYRMGLS